MMPISFRSPGKNSFSFSRRMNSRAAGMRCSTLIFSCAKVTGGCERRAKLCGAGVVRCSSEIAGLTVVLGRERAGDVAGADAQFEHHRRVARFRQFEALLDDVHDVRQIGSRIEQPDRGFQRIGVRALLDHRAAFAVILADDDQRAAHDAGGGEVGQRVGGDIGADDGLPGHRAADRVIDRGAEHGGGGGLVGAGLDMHAEFVEIVLGIDHDVEQVRHRRALIAADIGHARLQQRLGDGENALAVEGLPVAEPQRLHFFLE